MRTSRSRRDRHIARHDPRLDHRSLASSYPLREAVSVRLAREAHGHAGGLEGMTRAEFATPTGIRGSVKGDGPTTALVLHGGPGLSDYTEGLAEEGLRGG